VTPAPCAATSMRRVVLPNIPYGLWKNTAVGGVSKTSRLVGTLRVSTAHAGTTTVFAINAPSAKAVHDAFAVVSSDTIILGIAEHDDEYGYVTEINVEKAQDVEFVAARIARAGATPVLELDELNMRRSIGIERLDRIGAKVLGENDPTEDGTYGFRRGGENWHFSWIPDEWNSVPITWDHMVENVTNRSDYAHLPQPLRSRVACAMLSTESGVIGTKWRQEVHGTYQCNGPFDRLLEIPALQYELSRGKCSFDAETVSSWDISPPIDKHCYVRTSDGRLFQATDTGVSFRAEQRSTIQHGRKVSAALKTAQSQQLIQAFYLLYVERVQDRDVACACQLILFRFMFEQGYTARWLGKYEQFALHVGNGDKFRRFKRMKQYESHRLPSSVLNRLCKDDGTLHNRGSKGTRSKYAQSKCKKRYVPKRRMTRTPEDERRLMEEI